ncbi:superfamily I DNA and RNA helicases and helicase subunit [Candidatus Scalindua japonica]|uniref:Superfamily I DNA and RNA helicases and helicase subunit n=2 Tax=Candidatus Scalindua japonica TaxID=1284222 RepID=A0A286U095_9BACT|nr:superfamily I DNA and RNA helicases and helicase subunit [Candidatus Scalindua japonica]
MVASQKANEFAGYGSGNSHITPDIDIKDIEDIVKKPKTCKPCGSECDTALSPAAYLLDLFDFLRDTFTKETHEWSLADLDKRFFQNWKNLSLDCSSMEQSIRQVELANEVLEKFVKKYRAGWNRKRVYQEMRTLPGSGEPTVNRGILFQTFDAYLIEIATSRDEISQALNAGGDRLAELKERVPLTNAQLNSLNLQDNDIGIDELEALPAMVRQVTLHGIDKNQAPEDFEAAESKAASMNSRVAEVYLTQIRDNLIRLALSAYTGNQLREKTAKGLGEYLHIDLTASACCQTTRVAQSIVTLQSLMQAYQLGKETKYFQSWDVAWIHERWQWMKSYGTWHAAQMIYLYPENYMLQGMRSTRTPQYQTFIEDLQSEDASHGKVREGVWNYAKAIRGQLGAMSYGLEYHNNTSPLFVVGDHIIFVMKTYKFGMFFQRFTFDQQSGGWENVLNLPSHLFATAASFNNRLYLFFHADSGPGQEFQSLFDYTWYDPHHETPDVLPSRLTKAQTRVGYHDPNATLHNFQAISGENHMNLYIQTRKPDEQWKPNLLTGSRYHEFWATSLYGIRDGMTALDPELEFSKLRAIGRMNNREYLWAEANLKLWIIELENADRKLWDDRRYITMRAWFVRDFNSYPYYAGTVEGNRLILYFQDNNTKRISHFRPSQGIFNWRTLNVSMKSAFGMVAQGDQVILSGREETGAKEMKLLSFLFDGTSVDIQASTRILMDEELWAKIETLVPEPRSESALLGYRAGQLDFFNQLPVNSYGRLLFDEWFFFIPLAIAHELSYRGFFEEALRWFHLIFNPFQAEDSDKLIYAGFNQQTGNAVSLRDSDSWLRNPFNPHAVAGIRPGAYFRHVLITYLENVLDWADQLFGQDTMETINQARGLYQLVFDLLGYDAARADQCALKFEAVEQALVRKYDKKWVVRLTEAMDPLYEVPKEEEIPVALGRIEDWMYRSDTPEKFLSKINKIVARTLSDHGRRRHDDSKHSFSYIANEREANREIYLGIERNIFARNGYRTENDFFPEVKDWEVKKENDMVVEWIPEMVTYKFCIPPNSMLVLLRYRAESNLDKIRTCRNFAGMKRTLPTYGTILSPELALAQVAGGGDLELIPDEAPPIYRYSYVIERAKYFITVAQQMDSKLLTALEKEDAEAYGLLKAEQHQKTANANIKLQELRVREAESTTELADLQREKAEVSIDYFLGLIQGGLNEFEIASLYLMGLAAELHVAAAAAAIVSTNAGGTYSAGAAAASTAASASAQFAAYERRRAEWSHQGALARKDRAIAIQQRRIGLDRERIVNKELNIARMNQRFADDVVKFLSTKFTNKELYRWMARSIRRIYREHLNYALSIAHLAQQVLSFERQEAVNIIGHQYWDTEKKGLLAADNLLLDINKLDQHKFRTETRKRELVKQISLAAIDPVAFQHLRERGVMDFTTLMAWFDRDFPGHYMRMIKNVSLSFIALIPPREGIHATLRNSGISKIMVGPPFADLKTVIRAPEAISVTITNDGTGLFEVDLKDNMLLPFETSGVESQWTLELPKGANRFDFDTLVDVVMTINYTSLEHPQYREQTLRAMGEIKTEVATQRQYSEVEIESQSFFSVHNRFPDDWYHFHNPVFLADQSQYGFAPGNTIPPYHMKLELLPVLLPPNEKDHKLQRVIIASRGEQPGKLPLEISFKPRGTNTTYKVKADLDSGLLRINKNTQTVSGTNFPIDSKTPFGTWQIRIRTEENSSTYNAAFAGATTVENQKKITLRWLKDLMLVIQYSAKTEYPL